MDRERRKRRQIRGHSKRDTHHTLSHAYREIERYYIDRERSETAERSEGGREIKERERETDIQR